MYILLAVAGVLIEAFSIVLVIYCISSWFIRDPYNKFMRILSTIVDPVLDPIRSILSKISFLREFPIDFAPIVLFLILEFITTII